MESTIVLKMSYDGLWETNIDDRMEYKNGKVKTFYFKMMQLSNSLLLGCIKC